MPKIDLHCHSTVSDGLLAPADVVRRAAANGVDLLALTDHDDLSGLAQARQTAQELGVGFVDGVEISVDWEATSVHIVGLGIDPQNPQLVAGLAELRRGRHGRAERMAEALAAVGIQGALAGAARYAANPELIGRAHFARYIAELGLAKDVKSVFDHYLAAGKPGYVPHRWAGLDQAIAWIVGAGGVAVIAHPARYRLGSNSRRRLYDIFKTLGGKAIEVASGVHNQDEVRELAAVARRYGFAASTGSDFHGPGESQADLGQVLATPPDLETVWQRWLPT